MGLSTELSKAVHTFIKIRTDDWDTALTDFRVAFKDNSNVLTEYLETGLSWVK